MEQSHTRIQTYKLQYKLNWKCYWTRNNSESHHMMAKSAIKREKECTLRNGKLTKVELVRYEQKTGKQIKCRKLK